jgi:electron transfer flavoprotein alpha subunit
MLKIAVIIESDGARTNPLTWELMACGDALSKGDPAEIVLVLLAPQAPVLAAELARESGQAVLAVDTRDWPQQTTEMERDCLLALCAARRFDYVCLGHTNRGLEIGPGLAVGLAGACVTAVESLRWEGQTLLLRRRIWGGKLMAEVAVSQSPVVLTVLPGSFRPVPLKGTGQIGVEAVEVGVPQPRIRFESSCAAPTADVGLRRAKVVVAVGRGLGAADQLHAVRRLAALLPGSALAGSRVACDAGWLDYTHQVGVTGTRVAPALYLALGISGAFQHVTGMRGAGYVVAINKDLRAAIFNVADIGIAEDMHSFIPLLIAAIEAAEGTCTNCEA